MKIFALIAILAIVVGYVGALPFNRTLTRVTLQDQELIRELRKHMAKGPMINSPRIPRAEIADKDSTVQLDVTTGHGPPKDKRYRLPGNILRHDFSSGPKTRESEPKPNTMLRNWDTTQDEMPYLDSQRRVLDTQQAIEGHRIPDREAEIESTHRDGHDD